jgi:hypothetical protein
MCQDNLAADGDACGDDTETECDHADTCDGAGMCQDNLAASGDACGDDTETECDHADTCDGAGMCQDNLAASGDACGDDTETECDHADTCDGAGMCQDNLAASGDACGDDTETECDHADTCDGAGMCQDNLADDGSPCDDGDACTTTDFCGGGMCAGGPPPNCDDENVCTMDSCDGDECHSSFIEGCVDLDIRPGLCPNNFVRGVMGLLNMSLTGMPGFNAEYIDTSSLLLARADGVGGTLAPSSVDLGDLATPYPGALCGCHTLTTDGWDDLNLSFKNAAVNSVFLLNNLPSGQSVVLEITGSFRDGTPFSASDCIVLQSAMSAAAGHAR